MRAAISCFPLVVCFAFTFGNSPTVGINSNQIVAQEIGFLEDFVLAKSREDVLKQLVPGTEQYYYFHCLHYQNLQQLDKVDEMLKPWIKRFGVTQRVKQIQNRQALLKYEDDPKTTLDYLTRELNLYFAHQREIPQTQRDLPSKLDSELISTPRLITRALGAHSNTGGFTDKGLRLLAARELTKTQRRDLLKRLTHPDFPGLVDLIATDLKERDSRGFGSERIHQALTIEQLNELARKFPRAMSLENFVNTYLSKLHPSEDINWRSDPAEYRKYLERLWVFVKPLNQNFNSLKACVLFRRLSLDLDEGKYDRAMFMEYLKLPRNGFYINPLLVKNVESRSYIANLSANYSSRIMLPPVGNDEALIRKFLHHYLLDANTTKTFEPYVRQSYLSRQFAIVKILNGIGDSEKWASMLTPEEYKQVLDRVDVEFLSTNPEFFELDDNVELELYVKNVNNLIVKVFEINTSNYYRKYKREVDTDVNLDGLVPNFEETFSYDAPPALRKKRTYKFPQMKGRGVYVVDFIAGGKSSRALIRKGRLQMSDQVTSFGQLFTIIDQSGAVVSDADLWIAGARYLPDENGRVLVPFSTRPGRVNAIISQGNFSCLQAFDHVAENYQFKAAMVIDRENLTRSNTARVMIRPSLQIVGGNPVSVAKLKKPKLTITSENQDGISTVKVIDDLVFSEKSETVCEFVVPPRLKTISLTLSAELKVISRNETKNVSASQAFSINSMDQSDVIQDVHLVPTNRGYFLEILGKSGETRSKQAVRVSMKMEDFNSEVHVDLQSDENGLVELGPLANVSSVKAAAAGGAVKSWPIATQDQTYYQTIHAQTGSSVELPAPAGVVTTDRENISLLEVRRGTYVSDWFDKVKINDGLIKINDLAAGDYELRLTYPSQRGSSWFKKVKIRVTEGKQAENVLVGKHRHLEARGVRPLQVANVTTNEDKIRIRLENSDEYTRLHVIANRYQPAFNAYNLFAQIRDLEPWVRKPSIRRSVYMEGRKIGDEYEYILRRKYASKYPGNMLERPSLLLNPWEVQSTSNRSQDAAAGDDFGRAGNEADKSSKRGKSESKRSVGNVDFANLDFLGEDSVVLANLKPNKNGVVSVDRKLLGPFQHIRLIAVNAFNTVQRNVDLPLRKLVPRDARLAHALDPDKHFSQSKQTAILRANESLLIEDIISAQFQQYDDLGDVFQLMLTLNPGTHLPKFEFILSWDDKSEEEKHELYSKFACHELNFFLKKKDADFFDKVVIPHLKNKRDQTFLDQWFLESNLDEYVNPWKYSRLNTMEKILLSQRLEGRAADIIRNVNEQYLLAPTSRLQFDRLYDTTIRGLGMDSGFAGRRLGKKSGLPKLADAPAEPSSRSSVGRSDQSNKDRGLALADEMSAAEGDSEDDAMRFSRINANAPAPGGGGDGGGWAGRGRAPEMLFAEDAAKLSQEEMRRGELSLGGRGFIAGERLVELNEIEAKLKTLEKRDGAERNNVQLGSELQQKTVDFYFENAELGLGQQAVKKLYERLRPTKEWMENNYYLLRPEHQTVNLVQSNRFWRDYANHEGGTFLSPNFSESHRTFTEMMFAMAVLDLPLKAPKQSFDYVDNSMTFKAGGPTIALHQQVRDAIFDRGNTTILVSENFFQKNDRYRHEDGVRYDKFVSSDFLAHTLYGSQVVLTNPTSTPRAVDLLIQIPLGSVACSGSQETRTIQMDLAAFSTKTFEYAFYFPTAGDFEHYPAHVAAEEKVLAVADNVTFNVIDRPAEVDKSSWEFVSQNGTDQEVIEFLNQKNVLRLDLAKIAFRMKNKTFFDRTIRTLRNRYVYNHVLWAYAVKHNDPSAIREFLDHATQLISNCGMYFKSDLVTVNPVERNWYAHKEYWPLVNDRAHQLGPQRKILNPNFFAQYQQLLGVLANRRELTDDDQLVVTYYLLLQDRIESALEHFAEVSRENLESRIQYDYCDAYLDLYREKPNEAAAKAAKWADYSVDHWRNRFKHILSQVDEIHGGETETVDDRDTAQAQTELASKSESFEFEIDSGVAKIKYQNIEQVRVNFYEMDIELLFSRSPFAQDELDGFSMIRPNFAETLELNVNEKGKGSHEYALPDEMKNKNVLVEIVAGDQTKSQPYFAHSLNVQILEKYGQVHVTDDVSGKPISKTYVKVYARMIDGSVRFHKDGYTDLRGRFDYVSQSNRSIDGIQKFSILILSEDQGAVIRQSNPPKE